jgi:hypothetical protein
VITIYDRRGNNSDRGVLIYPVPGGIGVVSVVSDEDEEDLRTDLVRINADQCDKLLQILNTFSEISVDR